jgi:nucleotide-binding universal stress UspA family protein
MIRLARILVPTDFSEHSKKALRYAVALAQVPRLGDRAACTSSSCRSTGQLRVGPATIPPISEELRQAATNHLELMRKAEIPSGRALGAAIREGRPFFEICVAAREDHADLIVIATHGYSA